MKGVVFITCDSRTISFQDVITLALFPNFREGQAGKSCCWWYPAAVIYIMKCNLTRLVRCIVIVVVVILIINLALFLQSPQGPASGPFGEGFLPVLRRFSGHTGHHVYEPTTPAPVRLNSSTTCPGLHTIQPRTDGQFQPIVGRSMFIYSAFRDEEAVNIIGVFDDNSAVNALTCQLWFKVKGRDPLILTPAAQESMPENHGMRYTAVLIQCNIPGQWRNATIYAVSLVVGDPCSPAINMLLVPVPAKLSSQFTVCVTPLNYRYSRAYELVEMIEMNKLLGAQKFVFYNHTSGPNVDKVLEMYSRTAEVEVHPWHLPMKTDTWPPTGESEVHYFAQMAALNDCLYRHKTSSKYLVFADLDEFIIPYEHDNWADLITQREKQYGESAVFHFKCVFFRKEWQKSFKKLEAAAEKYKSVILKNTVRESEYLPYGTRSKYILNPKLTSLVGIHQVWRSSGKVDAVPEVAASLHHYRSWERPDDPLARVDDARAADAFGSRLVARLQEVWPRLDGVPMDINISTYGDHV